MRETKIKISLAILRLTCASMWIVSVTQGNAQCSGTVCGDPAIIGVGHSAVSSTSAICGGQNNTNLDILNTIAGGWLNMITANGAREDFIGGGQQNLISESGVCVIAGGIKNAIYTNSQYSVISGGSANTIMPNTGGYAVIAGGTLNSNCAFYGVIGGGELCALDENASYSGIGAGANNCIMEFSDRSWIGGGGANTIGTNSPFSTISGGGGNTIGDNSYNCTMAGGSGSIGTNCADATIGGGGPTYIGNNAPYATIIGGTENQIDDGAEGATVAGGGHNLVAGEYSMAAGYNVGVVYEGTFAWGDHQGGSFYTTGPNQFVVRAIGGIWFGTNSSPTIPSDHFIETQTGAYLSRGGAWNDSCDQNAKQGFESVDQDEVLKKVDSLPICSWSYKTESPSVRHLGPVAQDFHSLFGLGEDARHIAPIDESGVSLAAIQSLHRLLQDKEAQISLLKERVSGLQDRVQSQTADTATLERRCAAIEAAISKINSAPEAPLPH